jgi:glyoxylase-like metal-dependent hydrolase (beta-lactamase superfamily II)
MDKEIRHYRVGDSTVTRIVETVFSTLTPAGVFPQWDPGAGKQHASVLRRGGGLDQTENHLLLNINTWVVRVDGKTFLIDTGIGNGKNRPFSAAFHQLNNPYLERLASIGVHPEDVDYVLMTHLHVDHVGWNTRLIDGQWRPTFPNAQYVYPKAEREFYETPQSESRRMIFDDSVAPVVEAGLAEEIPSAQTEYVSGFVFHPTPGHSVGHMSISFSSQGAEALFTGDIAHHPVQVYEPQWNSVFCAEQDKARQSRQWAFDYGVRREATLFTPHFPESSAGIISRSGDGYMWKYL